MAADKKKADKKDAGKNDVDKKDKKKAAKGTEKEPVREFTASLKTSVKKSTTKVAAKRNIEIKVPRGGQVIKLFNLTPALPSATAHGDWIFATPGSKVDIANMTVRFKLNPSPLERELERAILVVSIQNSDVNGKWRFALGGVATPSGDSDPNNDIAVEIIDNGFTMLIYVQVLENSQDMIPFQFVASFTDAVTGVVSIYESNDPVIHPKRP